MAETVVRPPKMLPEARIQLAEFGRNVYMMSPEPGTSDNDLLESDYWSHVARRFKPCDRIEVYAEDGSSLIELHVLSAGPNWAKVVKLNKYDFVGSKKQAAAPIGHSVKFSNPIKKWRILRDVDSSVLKDGFETEEAAHHYLREHMKMITA